MRSDARTEDVLMCTANERLESVYKYCSCRSDADALADFGYTANMKAAHLALDVAGAIYS